VSQPCGTYRVTGESRLHFRAVDPDAQRRFPVPLLRAVDLDPRRRGVSEHAQRRFPVPLSTTQPHSPTPDSRFPLLPAVRYSHQVADVPHPHRFVLLPETTYLPSGVTATLVTPTRAP
jgi:hypothetical protein